MFQIESSSFLVSFLLTLQSGSIPSLLLSAVHGHSIYINIQMYSFEIQIKQAYTHVHNEILLVSGSLRLALIYCFLGV